MDRTKTVSPAVKTPAYTAVWLVIGMLMMAGMAGAYYLFITSQSEPLVVDQSAGITAAPVPKALITAPGLADRIQVLGQGFDGEVGISVQALDSNLRADFNGARPFPQQSVSKLWVAAAVLDRLDAGKLKLSDTITVTPADLTIFHQPIRKRIGSNGANVSIDELLTLAMTQSDNTANDVLFRKVGGKAGVESFLARKGVRGITMSTGEKDLQMQIAGMRWNDAYSYGRTFWQSRETVPFDTRVRAITAYAENPADGATPIGIAQELVKLQQGVLLSPASTTYLLGLMNQSKTGPDRLRGGLSPGWTMAHKTGTGQVLKRLATAYNDVGILTSPQGRQYAVVVMIGATNRPVPERQALMHQVVQEVIACDGIIQNGTVQSGTC